MPTPSKPKILLVYTGGTIGMIKDFGTGALRAFDFKKLQNKIPELKQLDCDIKTLSFKEPLDSSNMNPERWVQIATMIEKNYDDFDGFVVLHGSDTMSYSASALSFMLEHLDKPVVFTGAQLPIGDLRTDAKENLITAIQIASLRHRGKPAINEVCLYFEYKLYRGNRTTKINAERFNAFASPNYPPLAESGVHLKVNRDLLSTKNGTKKLIVHKQLEDSVAIIKMFPGINAGVLSAVLNIPNLKAIVLETYGAGNAPTEEWFVSAIGAAVKKGLHVVNVTQCSGGSVNMGQYETGTHLRDLGVVSGKDITTEAAITKIMYLLGQKVKGKAFKTIFETALRGELS
jgi:L-asparaginase